MDDELKVETIYSGGHVKDLGVVMDEDHPNYGWLVYRHPNEEWVALCSLYEVANEISSGESQRKLNSHLMKLMSEIETEKMLRLGGLEILVADEIISSGRARELGGYSIEEQRAYVRECMSAPPAEVPE